LRRQVNRVPGLAALQRALLRRVVSDRPFLHTLDAGPAAGVRFEISLPLDKAVWTGTYEQEFAEALAGSVTAGDVCYDIGGYRGYMSAAMAAAGASKVFVFEPLPTNQEALRRLCALNPQLPVELLPVAAGNVDEPARLKVMPETSMGKLASSPFQAGAPPVEEIVVAVCRLDTLVSRGDIPVPDVIRLDVEGAELDVLEAARTILANHHPRIFLEAHSAALDHACAERLRALGYEVRYLDPPIENESQTRHLIATRTGLTAAT
jgi:FkbM family methyltransferase